MNIRKLFDSSVSYYSTEFAARTGLHPADIQPSVATAREAGWLEVSGDLVRPTELGRRFTNDVVGLFLEDVA